MKTSSSGNNKNNSIRQVVYFFFLPDIFLFLYTSPVPPPSLNDGNMLLPVVVY